MQAQPMLLHDTSSNQLVETAILSTDFSQSAILQSALHPHSQPTRSSDRSPSRERITLLHAPETTNDSIVNIPLRLTIVGVHLHVILDPPHEAIVTRHLMSTTKARIATCHPGPAIESHELKDR